MSKNTCSTFHICVTVFPHISMYCFWESKSYKNLSLPPVSMSVVRECVFRRGCQTYWLHLWKDGKWKILHLTMELKLRYIHNCEEERFKGAITIKRKNSIVKSNPTIENLFQKLFSFSSEILSEMHKNAITLKGNFLLLFSYFRRQFQAIFLKMLVLITSEPFAWHVTLPLPQLMGSVQYFLLNPVFASLSIHWHWKNTYQYLSKFDKVPTVHPHRKEKISYCHFLWSVSNIKKSICSTFANKNWFQQQIVCF